MAASPTLPLQESAPGLSPDSSPPPELAIEKALAPADVRDERPLAAPDSPIARLLVELDVAVAVRPFRIRNLLALEPGQIIETQWGNGQDLPLAAGDVQLAWSEFEVVDSQLAVRLTRLV